MQQLLFIHYIFSLLLTLTGCNSVNPPSQSSAPKPGKLPLETIRLPEGFQISVFAEGLKNARSLAVSPSGTIFVGTRDRGHVYALRDTNGDHRADEVYTLAKGLKMPNGVAFLDGDLYVAEVSRILRFPNVEANLSNPPKPEVVFDQYPTDTHHGWKYIAFGPDGKLYVPVGAPCNICNPDNPVYASITRMNPDGSGMEIVQTGIRNTVGFTWHPETGELWFTDNGRDWLGDELPACELNHAPRDGMHFGYPFCHQGDLPDPDYGHLRNCNEFTPPVQNLGAHTAPLGLKFITSEAFPEAYRGQVLIAEHGSWNRSTKIGYRLSLVRLDGNRATSYEAFAEGWLDEAEDEVWGRPVDVLFLPDGSLLVSDDFADAIYRISYTGL
jgi:glucose/arabinose dehydrogenase